MLVRTLQYNRILYSLFLVIGAVVFANFITDPPPKIIIFGGVGAVLFAIGFMSWRFAVIGVLFLIVIEGALRKWVFPGYHEFLYIIKDIVLAGAYFKFFGGRIIRNKNLVLRHSINLFIGVLVAWGLVEAINPKLPNLQLGIFGLKAYFYYLPLIYMVPSLFQTKQELTEFLFIYSMFSVPVTFLGILQYFSPLESPLVTYLGWGEEAKVNAVSTVGMFPRVSGTFSYITGYVTYLFTVALVIIVLLNTSSSYSKKQKLGFFLVLLLVVVNILMTGSRWPVFMLVILIPLFLFMVKQFSSRHFRKLVLGLFIGFWVTGFVVLNFFAQAGSAFLDRANFANRDLSFRLEHMLIAPLELTGVSSGWGFGIGSTHQAAAFLVKDQPLFSWIPTSGFEGEGGRVMLELGLIGFFLFYILKLGFIYHLFILQKQIKGLDLRLLLLFVLMYHISYFFNSTIFNVTASIYFWFFSGFLFLIPKLDSEFKIKEV